MSWEMKNLDELGIVKRGASKHRPRDAAHLYGGPYPFIQTADVKHAGLYITDYTQTYSDAGLAQSRLWPQGTLCITIAANIADTSILKMDACFPDSVIGFIANPEKADARFIKYLFDGTLRKQFKCFTQGAAQDNLSQGKLLSLKFSVPQVAEQTRIADILSAYDDLIENNRRRIRLLEESARLLYNEWFVQLRFPGHEDVDVMDGVPVGWGRKSLGEVASTNIRSYKTKDLPEKIQYVDISSVCQGSIQSKKEMSSINAPGRAKRIAQFGDIVWSNVRPNLKAYALLLAIGEYDVFSTGFTIITAEKVPFTFLYLAVTTDDFVGYLNNQATGSSYPAVREADFSRATLTIPETSLLTKFDKKTLPLFLQVQILEQQNRALAQARDLLLPKLMNGEVSV